MVPCNFVTEVPYSGKNLVILASSGYEDLRFLTYRQAQSIGLVVRKGEKGIHLTRVIRGTSEDANGKKKNQSGLRGFVVFNITQTEKIQEPSEVSVDSSQESC
jgi:antirestriction protein ArdC